MIQTGLKKVRKDHRDYSYIKTYGIVPTTLPDEYMADADMWMPDQMAMGLPMGCTGFTQADLCTDEDGIIYDPRDLYEATPPGGRDGRDIRNSLKTLVSRGVRPYLTTDAPGNKRTAYFNIQRSGAIDSFDAIRLAMYSTSSENRTVSLGVPWFSEFTHPLPNGVLPIPLFDLSHATWHNCKVAGWKSIDGVPYLAIKSWQGTRYGVNGWVYMSRELCNVLLGFKGTGAFTVTKLSHGEVQTVDMNVVSRIISYVRSLFGL